MDDAEPCCLADNSTTIPLLRLFAVAVHFFGFRLTIVFLGEGAAQNGRMAETLNAAAKEKLPLLFLVIDNGRAINTFTPDVAANSDVFSQACGAATGGGGTVVGGPMTFRRPVRCKVGGIALHRL